LSGRIPPFDEIVDADDPERARLASVHELLVAAGPPAELPPSLEFAPPEPRAHTLTFERRRYTTIAAVAIAATVLFAVGYAVGGRNAPPTPVQTLTMKGAAGSVTGSLDLLPKDEAGNWPMTLSVEGLPPLPDGETYTLWLTKDGELAEPCGAFVVAGGKTTVPLNAPYRLKQFDEWVVVRTGTTGPVLLRNVAA
jgi:hypothetical protein